MKKFITYFCLLFLISLHSVLFSSEKKLKKQEERDPEYRTLIQDSLFAKAYESGRAKYQELHKLMQNNCTSDDGETFICQDGELTYVFYKKSKLIESFGFGYKIRVYQNGRIDKIDH